ncbi:MAG: DUF4011 domain-containing protein, partial [Clostridia bacterium]|nr:DUF4011 domain-containing protein [Clostridia bacterium]
MGKSIFTHYKDRLIEIGGGSKCIYLKGVTKRGAYDLGRVFEGRDGKISEFLDFLWEASAKRPLSVISAKEKREILENVDLESRIEFARQRNRYATDTSPKVSRTERRDEQKRVIEDEVSRLREIKRECEEIERECGRQELFVGYPFVFGTITHGSQQIKVKAPLLLFPVRIDSKDEETAELRFNESERIRINPALIFAYATAKKINADKIETEFDDMSSFRSIADVIDYLRRAHVKIEYTSSRNIYELARFKEPEDRSELSVRHAAVVGRFPLSSSIYNDYTDLERKKTTNEALDELLNRGKIKKKAKKVRTRAKKNAKIAPEPTYTVRPQDFAQSEVVRKSAECGNVVIYGPPGTGKSQTIVNIISDALAKGRRVLAVSQKRAALDVVYNRLGRLNSRCIYITDEAKERRAFYEKALDAHLSTMGTHSLDEAQLREEYKDILKRREDEIEKLNEISDVLNSTRPFGLSLAEMYSSSSTIAKNSYDYTVYTKLIESERLMSLNYKALSDAIFAIKDNDIERTFYDFMQSKEKNPLVGMTREDVDLNTLEEVRGRLASLQRSKKGAFDIARYPYARQLMSHYRDLSNEKVIRTMVKLECRANHPKKLFLGKEKAKMRADFEMTMRAIDEYAHDFDFLTAILTEDGFIALLDNLVAGNGSYLKLAADTASSYVSKRDVKCMFDAFDRNALALLEFAYSVAKGYTHFTEIIGKIIPIRIYHELTYYEQSEKDALAKTTDYTSIRSRIIKLDREACEVAEKISAVSGAHEYTELYGGREDNKDFLYQISKKQKLWPLRSTMELYSDYLFALFPCWLLSPENVSAILPLKKNMFDLVIFDEASQVFIESTVPSIIRGTSVVVAGDSKQLRPSSTFMKRYLGGDVDEISDVSVQAALEVESLLDLAVARYESAHLTYHYRSRRAELIDFSNSAFYSSKLCVAPNTDRCEDSPPIERIKVGGIFEHRRNKKEAVAVVDLLKKIF